MNYIIFNHDGSIKNVNFAEIIVQGNNLVDEIFVAVEGRSTDSYSATAFFELPNGEANFLTATLASHSIDQSPYNGYKFVLTEAQTALYGKVRMSIKLEGMQGEALWTYNQILTINKSGYNPDFTTITMSQYAALIQAMGSLQEKFVVNNARFYSSLANAQADLGNLAFNQCVIIADTSATDPIPQIYFKNAESQLELLAGIGEYTFQAGTTTTQTLSPGSDATVSVSFVASGKTITMNFEFGIPKGDTGATGNGIASIAKLSTEGRVDTYRITYTNGDHFDFEITNGTLAGHLLSATFQYDSDNASYNLGEQLARYIYGLIGADKDKLKQIVAYKPNNGGPGDSYNIVWRYANTMDSNGAGNFFFANPSTGVLTTIVGNLEAYDFSIFHEIEGTSVDDFGYIEIVDTSNVGSGTLTQAELVELRKPISFIRYQTGVRSYDMLISYYSARQANNTISKYFRGFMHKGSEDYDSAYAYNLSRSFITITNLNSTTTGGWSYTLNVDAYVDKTPTQNSTDLVTSGGVYSAIATASATLDSKISKNAEDIAILTEALIKKDLYETEEATFQGMTAVPAGAMVKAYLDGFKGNSAVVNQLVQNGNFADSTGWIANNASVSVSGNVLTATMTAIAAHKWGNGIYTSFTGIVGHRYYLIAYVKPDKTTTCQIALGYQDTNISGDISITANQWNMVAFVVNSMVTQNYARFQITPDATTWAVGDKVQYKQCMVIDIGINGITSSVSSEVKEALKHKGMDVDYYIPYNAGTLTDSKPTKLISRGYNLIGLDRTAGTLSGYDSSTTRLFEEGKYYAGLTMDGYYDATKITVNNVTSSSVSVTRSSGSYGVGFPVMVKPFATLTFEFTCTDTNYARVAYYDESGKFISYYYGNYGGAQTTRSETLDIPSNAYWAVLIFAPRQDNLLTTFTNVCLHLSSASLGYKPYVAPIEYDLTMPTLKSAGSVQDYVNNTDDGAKGKHLTNKYTFTGQETWSYDSYNYAAYIAKADAVQCVYGYAEAAPNILCEKYVTKNTYFLRQSDDKIISTNNPTSLPRFFIKDTSIISDDSQLSAFKTAITGVNVNYETNAPTDCTATMPAIFDVYAGGSVEVVGDGCDATTKVYFYVEA